MYIMFLFRVGWAMSSDEEVKGSETTPPG